MNKPKLILLLIILFTIGIRLWGLGDAPRGVLVDEPAFGYNAYSILKTGKDEHNKFLPLTFQSYGDQKMPAYVYTTVPFIALFGLNNFSVRLTAAVAGIGFVCLIYLILKQLQYSEKTVLIITFITALLPWTFILSRFSRESNLGLICVASAVFFLIKFAQTKKQLHLFSSFILLALSWYTYVAYRLMTAIFIPLILLYLFRKKLLTFKQIILAVCIVILAIAPILSQGANAIATSRFSQTTSDQGPILEIKDDRTYCSFQAPKFVCYLLWNKPVIYSKLFLTRALQTLSPEYLFLSGDKDLPIFNTDKQGLLYISLLPFYLLGIIQLFKNKQHSSLSKALVLLGALSSILPAILAGDPQKIRLAPLLIFVLLLLAEGITFTLNDKNVKRLLAPILLITLFESILFFTQFFAIHIHKYSVEYNSQIADVVPFVERQRTPQTKIIIKPFFSEPITNYAYFAKIDPKQYQTEVVLGAKDDSGFQHASALQNISVTEKPSPKDLCKDKNFTKILYVTDEKIPDYHRIYLGTSDNGVHELVYVYEISRDNSLCNQSK